jgi:hypothetical protein
MRENVLLSTLLLESVVKRLPWLSWKTEASCPIKSSRETYAPMREILGQVISRYVLIELKWISVHVGYFSAVIISTASSVLMGWFLLLFESCVASPFSTSRPGAEGPFVFGRCS